MQWSGTVVCRTGRAADARRSERRKKGEFMWIIMMMALALFSYWDIREKKLPCVWITAGILLSAVLSTWTNMKNGMDLWECILNIMTGMVPGGLLVLLSFLVKGKLGKGDGFILMMIINFVGMQRGLSVCMAAMGLSFVYSCILLAVCKKRKDYCFPFVPFYFLGAILAYGME